ncbi:MAG TPA: hypothetical protein PLD59_10775 [Tepidisphaeraceae bacterium]|nr:hypothetical protein [Tepidisphaeraceae bacterium]
MKITVMKQSYHSIFMQRPDGWFVGWVEEVRGTLSAARSLDECRSNLKAALKLIIETNRDEARVPVNRGMNCIEEAIEIDVDELVSAGGAPS